MTNQEAIKALQEFAFNYGLNNKMIDAFGKAIRALEEKEAKEQYEKWEAIEEEEAREYFERRKQDCVSREAVENVIKHAEVNFTVNSAIDFTKHKREVHEIVDGIVDAQIKALRALPPVTPQPKVGEWLKNGEFCKCSNCHSNVLLSTVKLYNYCPSCGSYNGGD